MLLTREYNKVLNLGLSRQAFLRVTAKGLAGLTIAPALLNLMGCTQEQVNSGGVQAIPTPKGVMVVKRARCTGCARCEIACTTYNDGIVGSFFSRVKIYPQYFWGDQGVGSGGGLYGDLNYTANTCRQCAKPECMAACPVKAIKFNEEKNCIVVNRKKCIGCAACTTACPWMMASVNPEIKKSGKCILCGECVKACPTGALSLIEWREITDDNRVASDDKTPNIDLPATI